MVETAEKERLTLTKKHSDRLRHLTQCVPSTALDQLRTNQRHLCRDERQTIGKEERAGIGAGGWRWGWGRARDRQRERERRTETRTARQTKGNTDIKMCLSASLYAPYHRLWMGITVT